jgi:hypothetical protein
MVTTMMMAMAVVMAVMPVMPAPVAATALILGKQMGG